MAEARGSARLLIATELGAAGGGLAAAAAVAVEALRDDRDAGAVVAELDASRARPPTLLASTTARELERSLRAAGLSGAAARGRLCWLGLAAGGPGLTELETALGAAAGARLMIAVVPPGLWRATLEQPELPVEGALIRADLPRERTLAALAVRELRQRGIPTRVASRALGRVATRRAVAGLPPGGEASRRASRVAARLLPASSRAGPREAATNRGGGSAAAVPAREAGQAIPLAVGAAFVVVLATLLLVALGGAVSGAARVQRAADLAALSAARSLHDDLPRALAPRHRSDGSPNPAHLERREYLGRAIAAARQAAARNGVAAGRVSVAFPDSGTFPPLRVRAVISAELDPSHLPAPGDAGARRALARRAGAIRVEADAVAEAAPPASYTGMPARASGGGYSGPLAYRQGEPMRPDVATAFDQLAAAARRAGLVLAVTSGYRSDAEQARLFAQNPDPRWVAPPGRSLHRCGTELDLGPPGAYAWLAANAPRFGFVRRYDWEPWHFGYDRGPAPCSASARFTAGADGPVALAGLPEFVPARFRDAIARSAARWGVSGALLAAQLLAESGFDPFAVSPAGARGIAQFMPGTAAAYGLRDPFDAPAAIDAQAHLMSDLLRQFGSVPLALAAYNAGPGAVVACGCVPPYPETRSYVARILGLLEGAGELAVPALEVRLVQ